MEDTPGVRVRAVKEEGVLARRQGRGDRKVIRWRAERTYDKSGLYHLHNHPRIPNFLCQSLGPSSKPSLTHRISSK
jgi:hypothetical protein